MQGGRGRGGRREKGGENKELEEAGENIGGRGRDRRQGRR
jgi:hypothetical protein